MKKYSKIIFVIFLIIFSAGLWLLNSNITRVPLLSDDNFYFVKGQVQEVIEDNTTNKEVNGGSQTVKVKITSGKYKGKTCEANNMNGYLYGTYCKKGTKVIVQLSSFGEELSGSIYGFDRGAFIWIIIAILGVALFLVGGKRGIKSMLALVFTFICIIYLYIPLMYIGFSPFWAAVIITIITTIVTMYLISGIAVKTLCAILGTVIGVLLAGLSAWLFGRVADIDGYNVSNIETLAYVGQITNIQIGGLLFSGILIASLGAVMDVAMSVSSAISEIHDKAPQLGCLELFKSGMNVGRDMMGTMSNTLILAFVGSAVSELVINYAYNLPFRQIINSYNIGIEIMQGVSGSIGVILTVPAVAVVTAWMLTRGAHAKNEGNVAE